MQLFYHPLLHKDLQQVQFSKQESQHIVKVLRKQVGDKIEVTNGAGDWFLCEIAIAHPKSCSIQVVEHQYYTKTHNYYLHMFVAPTKSNDRFEWFLEKATEIGVDEITPILTEYSERNRIKLERYEKIVLGAMKQSLQFYLPKLNQITSFKDILQVKSQQKFIAHCEDEQKSDLYKVINPGENYALLIGPEGDFSSTEIEMALQNSFKPISLGKNRLRTETAAIAACHSFSIKNNN